MVSDHYSFRSNKLMEYIHKNILNIMVVKPGDIIYLYLKLLHTVHEIRPLSKFMLALGERPCKFPKLM